MNSQEPPSDPVSDIAGMAAALGIVTLALFPWAVPGVILTIAAAVVIALPLLVLAAVGAIVTGVWLGLRAALSR